MAAHTLILLSFLLSGTMRDRYMPAKFHVEFAHFCTKESAVGRGVALAAEQNVQMYHLVEQSILYLSLRQVKIGAERNSYITISRAKPQRTVALIAKLAQICACTAKP